MLLNINKPAGITSHDVVDMVRKITGERRVGHAGTLDPFATGVLVVGVGRESTKKLGDISKNSEKEYAAIIELGKTSTTGDPEGDIVQSSKSKVKNLRRGGIEQALKKFKGEIEQAPPVYSAVKIKGVPAYKLARRGKEVALPKRKVKIFNLELLDFTPPLIKIRIVCSAGTYIRSLAEDIGKGLGVGAYAKELTRTRVGDFKIEDSKTVEELSKN